MYTQKFLCDRLFTMNFYTTMVNNSSLTFAFKNLTPPHTQMQPTIQLYVDMYVKVESKRL